MSSTTYKRRTSTSIKNKTQKNKVLKICNLGIKGTMKPCCNKDKDGIQCHVKPIFLDVFTKRLTRNNSIQMSKEHDDYKKEERKLFGPTDNQPTRLEISRKINTNGINEVKKERTNLANIIKMRKDWLHKWYIPPTIHTDCYSCDANARNHSIRISILEDCLKNYDDEIAKNERTISVSSRTRSASAAASVASKTMRSRPKLNLTKRKKDNYEKIDSITRRQRLVAMLAKKKESQERRRLSSEKKNKGSSKK